MQKGTIINILVVAFFGGLYLLPTIIAYYKKHKNVTPIALVNLFFGWTFIGWFIALIWGFTKDK